MDTPERFWSKVRRGEGCWTWLASTSPRGYGNIRWRGRKHRANRIAWELERGPVPEGMFVCHSCDNPSCVNPDHLFLGTAKDNAQDRTQKGRNRSCRGETHGMVKLTSQQVLEIRQRWAAGPPNQRLLAQEYGVCRPLISMIVHRRIWAHI